MSERFLIRQSELAGMERSLQQVCTAVSEAGDAGLRAMDQFLHNSAISGAFVSSAKAYARQVHRVMLMSISQAARALSRAARNYVDGYAGLDGQEGFVLPSDQMDCFRDRLKQSAGVLEDCAGQIRGILQSVASEITAGSGPRLSGEQAGRETGNLCARVQRFQEAVLRYESASLQRFSEVGAFMDQLENTLRFAGSGTCPALGFGVYVPGTFAALAGASAEFLTQKVMMDGLSSMGIDEEKLRTLQGYGYQPADLVKLLDSCETKADLDVLKGIFSGDYAKAFAMSTTGLSNAAALAVSDYALRVFEADDTGRFQDFVNGILFQNQGAGWVSQPAPGVRTVRMVYLEDLFQGTMALLGMNSALLLQGKASEDVKKKNWKLMQLAGLWSAQCHLEEELQYRADPLYPPMVVFSDPSTGDHELAFTYYYTKASHNPFSNRREAASVEAALNLLETSEDLMNGTYLAERDRLQDTADHLLQQVLGESLFSAGSSVLSVILPEAGLAVRMLESAVEQDESDIDDRMLELAGAVLPDGTGNTGFVLGEAIDGLQTYLDKNAELSSRIGQLDRLYEGSMWGSGIRSVYEVPDLFSDGERTHILSGIYNPDYLETIGRWNREGITALVPEADPDRIGQLWDSRPEYSTLGTDSLEYKMIHGFGGESILDYPINDIAEAKNTLEQIVREAFPENPALSSWNVENAF